MPQTPPRNDQWLANQIAQLRADVAALKAQRTQYICTPAGVCVAIIGNLAADQNGVSTGLTGWGIASHRTGSWVQL